MYVMSQKLAASEQKMTEDKLLTNLTGLFSEIEKTGDGDQSKKVRQLIKKLYDREYSIGFCGHFSAGKSSMINELAGSEILPSSPIPTSANLVKVRSGDENARVYLFNGDVVEFPSPYDIDEIKRFCKDGQEVEWIEIGTNSTFIPNGVTILDTPGIDSVDDAHRVSTESALHLADIIFYMMDYNHVQSEVSFHFTKKLQEMDKPLYLIINQIDKHQESELPFNEFKVVVKQAFHDWGVEPNNIFYTSLRENENSYNQLSDLKSFLSLLWENRDESLVQGILNAVENIIGDHLEWVEESKQSETVKWEKDLTDLTNEDKQELFTKINNIEQELQTLHSYTSNSKLWFGHELSKVLDNAYIMPFQTRELAKRFLESVQSDFKVGLFFSKQKTEKERDDRLQAFHHDLMEKVNSQIDWHVKELLVNFCKRYELSETETNQIYEMKVIVEPNDLRNMVKQGAQVTGDSVLNFTNDIASECKKRFRFAAVELVEKWLQIMGRQSKIKIGDLKEELKLYEKYKNSIQQLIKLDEESQQLKMALTEILWQGPTQNVANIRKSILASFETMKKVSNRKNNSVPFTKKDIKQAVNESPDETEQIAGPVAKVKAIDMVAKIDSVVSSLHHIRGLQTVVEQLTEKAERLKNQSFTVALFGAFSAGKSSFANALMGTKLLPVSPNPTTATINKIKPVTEEFPHGTVRVQVKAEQQLENDLAFSLKFFDVSFTSISESLVQIQDILKLEHIEPRQKPHYSFLKAVLNGFDSIKDNFGQLLYVNIDEFADFVAKEEKSCFVEWIEVYYECELTNHGITLVDTPGADSINARHTGVAFEYIKNADAILFVTYYNHAFSKADREFLIQLGRVKDAFELDKMFFMINAADLASSSEELQLVKSYVNNQLLSYGIRNPRLYPISSLLAIKEKQGEKVANHTIMNDSGIDNFEADFKDFIQYELTELTVTSASLDLKRVKSILNQYIDTALIGNEEKEARKTRLEAERKEIFSTIKNNKFESSQKALEKEVKELLYYVKQRVFLRFTDMFNETFHPSVLSDDHKNIKQALNNSLDELLEFVAFDLIQELRATSVRNEGFLRKQIKSIHQSTNREIETIHASLQLTYVNPSKVELLEFVSLADQLGKQIFQKTLASFKNAKAFFEKGGKKDMKDELEKLLQEPVSRYIEMYEEEMKKYYSSIFIKQLDQWIQAAEQEVDNYFDGLKEILTEKMDIEELKRIENQVSQMI
jgi:small GTP-binding protein